MTTLLRTMLQQTAVKLPGIFYILVLVFAFFLTFSQFAVAQNVPGLNNDSDFIPGVNTGTIPGQTIGTPFLFNPDTDMPPPSGSGGGQTTGTPLQFNPDTDMPPPPQEQPPIVIGDGFLDSLYGFIVIFGGKLVGWSGKLLNWAIGDFVIGFGDVYLTWGVGVAVEKGWEIIRDVLNISFIFGIVYIGIRLIFDADDSSAKRSLGYLLAAALLINFSLFISKFVVDFSNSLAAVIYNTGLVDAQEDLASSFINILGLSTVIDNGSGTLTVGSEVSGGLAIIFGTFIFMLLATYALAAGAFLIFIRGIALIFFMIFSPIMFLGWIFPQFRTFTSKYWSMFLSNAFMAPAYIFCIYLTFTIMDGFKYQIRTTGQGSMGDLFSESYAGNVNGLVVFTLAIGMMLASISVAKRMGAFGGGLVVSVGNTMRKSGQGFIGRNTVGRAASGLGNINDKMEGSRTGRNFKRALSVASLGTLDERSRRNIVNTGKSAKFGSSYSYEDNKKLASEISTTRAQGTLNSTVARGLRSNASDTDKIALEREVSGANQSQLISLLSKYKSSSPEYGRIVQAMSHNQVTKLLDAKSDEFDDGAKSTLAKVRGVEVSKRLTNAHNHIQEALPKATTEDLVAMGYETMKNNAFFLTAKQMEELKGKLTPTEYANIEKERNDKIEQTFANPNNRGAIFKKPKWNSASNRVEYNDLKKDSEIAKLPAKILVEVGSLQFMNPKVLDEILRNDLLDSSQRNTIRSNISTLHSQANPPTNIRSLHDWLNSTPAGRSF